MGHALQTGKGPGRSKERGYTLLGLMFLLAIGGVLLLQVAETHQLQSQREREEELIFRGEALSRAIDEFARLSPPGQRRWPTTLDELVLDRRSVALQRHLRQIYADPFTGKPDWELIPATDEPGGFVGVRSRAQVPALRKRTPRVDAGASADASPAGVCVCDWAFVARRGQAQPSTGR